MQLFIQKQKGENWVEITKYVQGVIGMNLTVDGKFSTLDFSLITPSSVGTFDTTKTLPPKINVKVVDSDLTYYFITTIDKSVRLRKALNDTLEPLYEHNVSCVELLSVLDGRYLPNYTITQPKSIYYDVYTKSSGVKFRLEQKLSQNGGITLNEGIRQDLANTNNNGNILYGYDNTVKKHYVEFNELDQTGLNIDFNLMFSKSATGTIKGTFGINYNIVVGDEYGYDLNSKNSNMIATTSIYYFNDEFSYGSYKTSSNKVIRYNGGELEWERKLPAVLTSLGVETVETTNVIVPKSSYKKCRVYIDLSNTNKEYMWRETWTDEYVGVDTNINGYNNDQYVKVFFDSLNIKATTGVYEGEIVDKKITLLEFVEKAIHDYNFNTRNKVFLNDETKVLLDVPAKEGEWNDYTLKELLYRAFNYVGIKPFLNNNGEISHIKTSRVSRYIDLDLALGKQSEHNGDDFYDKVISNAKNLVSEEDLVTEILPITSTDAEFSRVTTENAGFKAGNDIYYVAKGILYTPGFEVKLKSDNITKIVKSNIGRDYYWDITKRLFEDDIYNSFPNVRADYIVGDDEISLRAYSDILSKANTISYKSGSNVINNLFNQGETLPDYKWYHTVLGTIPSYTAEYSIVEMLIFLSYETLDNTFGYNTDTKLDLYLKDIINFELELTYAPIFNELTTKFVSNMETRKGLNYEKKVNIQNKLISYQESEKILRNEMQLKGNEKILYSEIYKSLDEVIPYNSIINDNLYITTANIIISKNAVEVDYVLQRNFIIQNDDIGLPVAFERYAVPYEFVKREVMVENHLIFSRGLNLQYTNEPRGSKDTFILNTLLGSGINGTLYSKLKVDGRDYLMRMAKLETRFTLVLSGMFTDNYTAGYQRYNGANQGIYYTEPLRYTDGNGKFESTTRLQIGYSNINNALRLKDINGNRFDVKEFPDGLYVDLDETLIDIDETVVIKKDAREQIAITHTSYLESNEPNIKFYSFKEITHIATLVDDIELVDDLELSDINYANVSDHFNLELRLVANNNYEIRIKDSDYYMYENGIVFLSNGELVGVIKEPTLDYDEFIFFISLSRYSSTRYGYHDDSVYVFDIYDELEYTVNSSGVSQRTYIIDIEDDINNKVSINTTIQDLYIFDINDNISYNIVNTIITQREYTMTIYDIVENETNTNAIIQRSYEMLVNDDIRNKTTTNAIIQQEYEMLINDNITNSVVVNAIIQRSYEMLVNDDIRNKTTTNAVIQNSYEMLVNDSVMNNVLVNAVIQKSYSVEINDNIISDVSVNEYRNIQSGVFPNSINDNFPLDYQYIFNNKQRIIDVRINGDSYYYYFVYEGTQDEAIIIEYYGDIYLDVYNGWDYEGDYDNELKGQTIEIEFEV